MPYFLHVLTLAIARRIINLININSYANPISPQGDLY